MDSYGCASVHTELYPKRRDSIPLITSSQVPKAHIRRSSLVGVYLGTYSTEYARMRGRAVGISDSRMNERIRTCEVGGIEEKLWTKHLATKPRHHRDASTVKYVAAHEQRAAGVWGCRRRYLLPHYSESIVSATSSIQQAVTPPQTNHNHLRLDLWLRH